MKMRKLQSTPEPTVHPTKPYETCSFKMGVVVSVLCWRAHTLCMALSDLLNSTLLIRYSSRVAILPITTYSTSLKWP